MVSRRLLGMIALASLVGCALIDAAKSQDPFCDQAIDLGHPNTNRVIDTCRTPSNRSPSCGFNTPGAKLQFEVDHQDHYRICASGFTGPFDLSLSDDCSGNHLLTSCRPGPCIDADLGPGRFVVLFDANGCANSLSVSVTAGGGGPPDAGAGGIPDAGGLCTAGPEVCNVCTMPAGCYGDIQTCSQHLGCLQPQGGACVSEFNALMDCLASVQGRCFPSGASKPCFTEAMGLQMCKADPNLYTNCGICPGSCPL